MSEIEVMLPLYPPSGAPVCGYVCTQAKRCYCGGTHNETALKKCKAVTKTKSGMWAHLRIVHGITKQAKLDFEKAGAA